MAWRDEIRQASFRGAAFHVADRDGEGGRRTVLHEYPLRDLGHVEDLGRSTRRFVVNGYVLGADYTAARDRLIDALEAAGPGEYVDRYGRGTVQAQVVRFRWRESDGEGGRCDVTIEFVEAGERREPTAAVDTRAGLITAADAVDVAADADMTDDFSADRVADFVADGARSVLVEVANAVALVAGAPGAAVSALVSVAGDAAAVLTGALVAPLIRGAVAEVADALPLSRMTSTLAPLAGLTSTLPGLAEITPSRIRRNANTRALMSLTRRAALTTMARSIAVADLGTALGSYDDVSAVRSAVVDVMDGELVRTADAGPSSVIAPLRAMIGAVSRDLSARGQTLAPLTRSVSPALLPAVVLSHRYYGTPDRSAELQRRATVPHPGFMPTELVRLAR